MHDVIGLGAVALDEFLYVDEFPAPDTKVRVKEFHIRCGGLTGNALVTAARMGARCAYAGRLGRSADAQTIDEALTREGVDTSHASRAAEDGIVKSTIIIGTASLTRNVFSRATGLTGAQAAGPDAGVIRSGRVLFLDHHGGTGALRAAAIAAAAGIPVVGDYERSDAPCIRELLALTGHLIVPEAFAAAITGAERPEEAARRLSAKPGRAITIVTSGAAGCWVAEGAGDPVHAPAFRVEAVDTACCGDVFHGAYAAALAFGMALRERILFASAAAALKATRSGGHRSIPYRAEVDAFLLQHAA